jgi:hypothetical protein
VVGRIVPEVQDCEKLEPWAVLVRWPLGPNSLIQPMEDPSETWWSAPSRSPCLPWATLFFLYSLVSLISYFLEVASHGLLTWAAGPLLPFPCLLPGLVTTRSSPISLSLCSCH